MRNMTPAALRIQKARTTLLLDHPFFGTLLFRLKSQESNRIPTMATDGVSLFYNPDFVDILTSATLAGVLAHEVMHPALQHHVRRSGRNSRRWNEACDYAINPLLVDAGLSLPEGVLLDSRFSGMSAEQIYVQLESKEQPQSNSQDCQAADENGGASDRDQGQGALGSQPVPVTQGGVGQVLDAPVPDEETPSIEEQERDWSVAVRQAVTLSKQAGKTPAGLARTLEGAAEATLDWRELLHRLCSETTPADFSWARPNRRHIWNGLYLPELCAMAWGRSR
jgi:predicted metal-dependent peptidase